MTAFALHPGLNAPAAAARFAADGRLRLQPFLTEDCAANLHRELRRREDWRQVINSGDKVFDLDRPTRARMTAERQTALDAAVIAGAREGFQYRYESLRLPDGDVTTTPDENDFLSGFTRWLSSGAAFAFLCAVVGPDISFADGQATAYAPGDFLTGHDDAVTGKHRRAAYVLGLTPLWRVEWGGLLLFHHDGGAVSGHMPAYNSLDLFAVPQLHSVSQVTASAAYRRYAITGWLRGART